MTRQFALATSAFILTLFPLAATSTASAQAATETSKSAPARSESASWPIHIYYLKTDDQFAINELVTVIRNAIGSVPGSSIVPDFTQKAIVIREDPADIPFIEKILADLNRPPKSYRLTYTLTDLDGAKQIGSQRFSMVLVSGQKTEVRQGSKVPTSTGPMQISYTDIGMNFESTLQDMGTTARLRFDVEQSSVASAPTDPQQNPNTPTMRQTTLKGEATITPGQPLMLGSIDIAGSTRRLDVEALIEPLP